MYSLRLTCTEEEIDRLSAQLWEHGTTGICELESHGRVVLIAEFEDARVEEVLLSALSEFGPEWQENADTDWIAWTEQAWPAQKIGERIFLVAPWNRDVAPAGRISIIQNPGLACGTGRHPCSRLAMMAIERYLESGSRIADIGTGSGILAIAAKKFGAAGAIGVDVDEFALASAHQNFVLNGLEAELVCGSADCLPDGWADITVANISATVLISIADDLVRITREDGWLIMTGFDESELPAFQNWFGVGEVTAIDEWRCVSVKLSSAYGS